MRSAPSDDHQDRGGDAHRPAVDVAHLVGHLADPPDSRGSLGVHPEDDRELADDDLDGDPGQDTGDHRSGQELGDPPKAAETDGDQQTADQQGGEGHRRHTGGSDRCHRGHTGGEHRRDGGVRSADR